MESGFWKSSGDYYLPGIAAGLSALGVTRLTYNPAENL
jgi:hypothetical protein